MQPKPAQLPWKQDGWIQESTAWIQGQLDALEYHRMGPVEILHQRPWSCFCRVVTDRGVVYFKAPAPAFHYEAGVTQLLARLRPDCTVRILAVEPERGWMLSADAGNTLRSVSPSVNQINHWEKILPFYADFQLDLARSVPELLALEMYDRRLEGLPRQYVELLEQGDSLRVGLDPGLTLMELQRLHDLRTQVSAWCEELAGLRLPETLMHEEIHDANVLVNGKQYIFTDWSDSSVSHPFFSILVILRAAAHRLKLDEEGPEMRRVRDAYLEPWTNYATRADLSAGLKLAYHLAMITRALAWYYGTGSLPDEDKEPYLDYVSGWLQDFITYDHRGE